MEIITAQLLPCYPLIKELLWLPTKQCCIFKTELLVFKFLCTGFPKYFNPFPKIRKSAYNTHASQPDSVVLENPIKGKLNWIEHGALNSYVLYNGFCIVKLEHLKSEFRISKIYINLSLEATSQNCGTKIIEKSNGNLKLACLQPISLDFGDSNFWEWTAHCICTYRQAEKCL